MFSEYLSVSRSMAFGLIKCSLDFDFGVSGIASVRLYNYAYGMCVYIICIIEPCLAQYCPVPENFVGLLVCFEIFEFEFLNFDLPRAMVQSFEPKVRVLVLGQHL